MGIQKFSRPSCEVFLWRYRSSVDLPVRLCSYGDIIGLPVRLYLHAGLGVRLCSYAGIGCLPVEVVLA